MSNCTKIRLREVPETIPSDWLDSSGCLYFDLLDGERLQTKTCEQLNSNNEIEFDRSVGVTLAATDRNQEIIDCFIASENIGQKYELIPVDLIEDDCIESDKVLRIERCTADGIEITLELDENHWAKLMQDCCLGDLDLGTYTHQCLSDAMANNSPVYNGTDSTYISIEDYGEMVRCGTAIQVLPNGNRTRCLRISGSYHRPKIFTEAIMEALMCKIGYEFDAPIRNTEKWNRLSEYQIRSDFGQDQASLDSITVELSNDPYPSASWGLGTVYEDFTSAEGNNHNTIEFFTDNDPAGLWDSRGRLCNAAGCYNIRAAVTMRLSTFDNDHPDLPSDVKVCLVRYKKHNRPPGYEKIIRFGGNGEEILAEANYTNDTGSEEFLQLSADNVTVYPHDDIRLVWKVGEFIENFNFIFMSLTSAFLNFIPTRKYLQVGETYDVAKDLIGCTDRNALDWFKAHAHMQNWKLNTNQGRRTVEGKSPYSLSWCQDNTDGFINEESALDWKDKVIQKTKVIDRPEDDEPRFCEISFKKSTDCYVESLDLENELYSKTIDRGAQFDNSETKTLDNGYFEPTANGQISLVDTGRNIYNDNFDYFDIINADYVPFATGEEFVAFNTLCLPKICGEDGNLDTQKDTWIICPRIGYNYGNVLHGDLPVSDGNITYERICLLISDCEEFDTQLIPTWSQLPCEVGQHNDLVTAPTLDLQNNLLFADISDQNGNLVPTLFTNYERWLFEQVNEAQYNFEVNLSPFDFDCIDFKTCVELLVDGKPITMRIGQVNDFNRCGEGLTSIDFKPLTQEVFCPYVAPDNNVTCFNRPALFCQRDGDCYTLSLGGVNNAVITSVNFFIEQNGSTSQIPNTGPLTAEVCGQTDVFCVYAEVTYSDIDGEPCEDQTTTKKTINPCIVSPPVLTCTGLYQGNDYCIKADISAPGQPYTVVSFTANGQPYAEGDLICGVDENTTILFEATIDYDNDSCPPIDVTLECAAPIPAQDCSLNIAEIICNPQPSGCLLPQLVGTYTSPPIGFLIWYVCQTDVPTAETLGCQWDFKSEICCPEGERVFIRGAVLFKDCPNLCVDWVECEVACPPCEAVIECTGCIAEITDDCGRTWEWYDLPALANENNPPTLDVTAVMSQGVNIGSGQTTTLADDRDNWYAAVGNIGGFCEVVLFYYHDAPQTGDVINTPIDV